MSRLILILAALCLMATACSGADTVGSDAASVADDVEAVVEAGSEAVAGGDLDAVLNSFGVDPDAATEACTAFEDVTNIALDLDGYRTLDTVSFEDVSAALRDGVDQILTVVPTELAGVRADLQDLVEIAPTAEDAAAAGYDEVDVDALVTRLLDADAVLCQDGDPSLLGDQPLQQ